ncbi:MAG: hypothetical protein RLZZ562_1754 [Planctomycetota bacterium]
MRRTATEGARCAGAAELAVHGNRRRADDAPLCDTWAMRHPLSHGIGAFASIVLSALAAAQSPPERIFDGASLSGWDGDPKVWSVQDGCITGRSDGTLAQNTFLIWKGEEAADFELTYSVRVEGDNNSGVQYRSRRLSSDGFAVAGPQCDAHGAPGYFGMIYEEGGRGILITSGQRMHIDASGNKLVQSDSKPGATDLTKWHAMRIVARGTTVQHFVDGALAIDLTDDSGKLARSGILALQVHSGAAMKVQFKDLVLTRLPKSEVAVTGAPIAQNAAVVPNWIWDASAGADEELFFRREVALQDAPKSAVLHITADNNFRAYVNGEKVGESASWESPRRLDVTKLLRAGNNAIAVHAWNDGGPAGMCAQLAWRAGSASGVVATDAAWRVGSDDPDGWDRAGFDDAKWGAATVICALGEGPWSGALAADAFTIDLDPAAPQKVEATKDLAVPQGWTAERLLAVPRAFGSWVCMCSDPQGRLYASDQQRGLYRITPAGVLGNAETTIERVDIDLPGCQGLCFAFGALYAVVNHGKPGLHRLTDRNGDGALDHAELLRALDGDGEHGPHAVEIAPDGEHLLVLCGNHVLPPQLSGSRVTRPFVEDVLVPGINDPNGHAVGIKAPGGYVCRVDKDGKEWEMLCCGFRNAYDLAVLPSGDVVTFDADMEWDMGMPWYRPTRILQVLSGVDYGWRTGSRKWGADLPDTLPAVCDIGPGSPTGVVAFGNGALALDWTFGTAYAVALHENGAMLQGRAQPFASGVPLPLTEAVVDRDRGIVYVLTGGRGLPSRLYRLTHESGKANVKALPQSVARIERLRLEVFHGKQDERAIDAAWPLLGDEDAALRHAARVAVESQPVAQWRERALAERSSPWRQLHALVALCRCGSSEDLEPVLNALSLIDSSSLSGSQRIAWLRAHELALMRLGPVNPSQRERVADLLLPKFPSGDDREDQLMIGLLAHVDAKGLLDVALPMLTPIRPSAPPAWAEIAKRNKNYGGAITTMLGAMPPAQQIAIAYALRNVKAGWTMEQREAYFAFMAEAKKQKGGASYQGFCKHIVEDAYANCSEAEKAQLADAVGKARAEPKPFVATQPKGPGRRWQLDEAKAIARTQLQRERDLQNGRNLFYATGCAGCHRFSGEGKGVGPDLTSLGNKFSADDVLEAILEPSKVVSDQFAGAVLTKKDGSTVFGRVSRREDDGSIVHEVVTATADAAVVRVADADVARVEPAKLSVMPQGLVDRCSEAELMDLLAYLLSRGN